ncbi:DUF7002 family protein [Paenibacillus sp. N3.4]|uniref:DUF7002 family protein n=1 Tax=Paenibacillus sp. N3.4 TaxID=2603222 RepID=UPI0011C9F217|nr:hypothetical protein [Paenibacillus sp. N3.4]TXK85192.1 hypothetical protein FU659_05525 [Paenibacillus sp. N3.4]
MRDTVITAITKAMNRQSLYHFTRRRNLPAIAHFDALLSSYHINPLLPGERRLEIKEVNVDEQLMTINAHLRIPDSMLEVGITQEQFRACLDRHVFFWPTKKDCRKMLDTYARREPDEGFAVLEFDAYSLLTAYYSSVKLSKYDSGSSPRFPKHCFYKKSLDMFLPIDNFKSVWNHTIPTKPSEIREVLIEERVSNVSHYLRTVYVDHSELIPERWKSRAKPLASL